MQNTRLQILTALCGGLVAMATVMSDIGTSTPADQTVAARPHLRQRTDRFFDRAIRTNRDTQSAPSSKTPGPSPKPVPCVLG